MSKRLTKTIVVAMCLGLLALGVYVFLRPMNRFTGVPAAISSKHLKPPAAPVTTPAIETQEKIVLDDNSKKSGSTFSGIDESVVGQAFQVSASVKEGCRRDTIECPVVMDSVARMIKEPRDRDWATHVEEKIQAAVDGQGPGRYVIRNLECRTSICILEVEVHTPGAFNGRYEGAITSILRPN